nr:hypothetical protein [Mycobacterium uberis]
MRDSRWGAIRSIAGIGTVMAAVGLVFTFTIVAMLGSELRIIG